MLKNKMKIITLILVMILSLTIPLVSFAEETAENNIMPINETETTTENQVTTPTEDTFKKSDVYLIGDNITIDYIVDGNLFVIADTVTINSQIGGDAFICANNLTVSEQGYVFSNLFAIGNNIEVKGVVYDLYSISNNLLISGYVYRDIRSTSQSVNISGTVGRNAFIDSGNLAFAVPNAEEGTTARGLINGNFEYSSSNEIEIPEGAVKGEVKFEQEIVSNTNTIQNYLLSLGSITASTILVWLLCLWLTPKFLGNTSNLLTKKPLKIIGLGIITPVILTIASILLIVLGLTTGFGLLVLSALCILIAISTSIFIITINNLVCNKLNITKNIRVFGMLVATSIVLWLIGLIPYVGGIIGFVGVIIGMGIISTNLLNKNSKNKEPKKEITE